MNGLLSLEKDMLLQIDINKKNDTNLFKCEDIVTFENGANYLSTRYLLSNDDQRYILDVQKDSMQNISLTYYQLIEKMEFDLNFLSLVGTSPLGYHNPNIPNIDYVLYEKLEKFHDDNEMIKFMVTEDELPQNPQELGYYQDGNKHWYFMTNRTKGELLKFKDEYKLSWEYKQEKDERLLIELQAFKNMQDYIHKKPTIYIYEGKSLHRRDIKIVVEERLLESA
ncbi:MAG TPA: hypothetical protein EYG95_02020 [Campylobacterales bacterium]|nr:hypothetical protein [Campylobacterales bacterium]